MMLHVAILSKCILIQETLSCLDKLFQLLIIKQIDLFSTIFYFSSFFQKILRYMKKFAAVFR